MKATLLVAGVMLVATHAQSAPAAQVLTSPSALPIVLSGGSTTYEVKGRTGSKRVGGTNSKGKGGRYVGGRK